MSIRRLPLVCLAVLLCRHASAAPPADKTLSPYFVVEGGDSKTESLPLESTHADVHIAGVISDVVVTQTYRNDGQTTISARYVFPASTRAAVYGMKMTIGDRVIVAKIKEREAARQEYEEAKQEGKTASLLEEDRPNVFTMNVANILPKDHIQVELRYTELLVPTEGMYELVYPTVVGPRYASETVDAKDAHNQFVAAPYQHAGQAPMSTFGIDVSLDGGMPIQSIESPSHKVLTSFATGRATAKVALDASEQGAGGNRDFILRYRLAGADIATGMLLYPGKDESFFLMMVQPPARPATEQIPSREYVFIVDVSGSMNGFPLDVAKRLMRDLLSHLRPTDKFDIELFSGASIMYKDASVAATAKNIDDAIAFMTAEQGGGGTELLPAMQRAMQLPRATGAVSRTFVVITDGFISEETAMFEHVRDHLGEQNVFAFGIGSSVNRHLIEGIAKAGQGEAFVVENGDHAEETAKHFAEYVSSPVLTQVKVAMEGFDAYDIEPKVLPDVFAQRPVVVFGKYRGNPTGKATLTGVSGSGRFVNAFDVGKAAPNAGNAALQYLWARKRISEMSDYNQGETNKDAVVALGLKYNLLTPFTSFIAVQQLVRAATPGVDVDQPLPMPAGVSDLAIEQGDEPGLWILLAFVTLGIAWHVRRSVA